ncbi:MAG: hypothetical protein GX796_05430, partial [Clostridiaceae bacterium]|nr:hypothetical protein [Clostridiaceae bacterium]
MAYTESQIEMFADWFVETSAASLAALPSTFGVVTGIDEIARAWRLEVSDEVATSVALLRMVASVDNLVDCDPTNLTQEYAVTNPMVDGVEHEGLYRSSDIRVYRQMDAGTEYFYIIQILRKGWVESVDDGDGGIDFTEFRELSGRHFRAGRTMLILSLQGVAADSVRTICDYINSFDTFSDIDYFNDTLSGDWYKLVVQSSITDDGSYTIQLSLADQWSTDLIFPYYANTTDLRAEFFKLNMAPDEVAAFKSTYYFDNEGNFYVSANGTTYTKKNGEEASGSLPSTAYLLSQNPASRCVVNYSANSKEETGDIDVRISFIWFSDDSEKWTIYQGAYGETRTTVLLEDVSEERRDDFVENTYLASDGHGYYSEDGTNYALKDGEPASGTLSSVGAKGLNEVVEGRQVEIRTQQDRTTRLWTVMVEVRIMSSDKRCSWDYIGSDTRLSYKANRNTSVTIDQAYNVTYTELAAAMAYYNTTPADGVKRQISQPRLDPSTGLYSFEAIEVTTSSETVGSENPSTANNPTTTYVFQFGDLLDYNRFVCKKTGQTITPGALNLLSYFEDVPAEEGNPFGLTDPLPNLRKVTPFIRNHVIVDGMLEYELWERVLTPQINDGDAWFYHGATEAYDRRSEMLSNEVISPKGYLFSGVKLDVGTGAHERRNFSPFSELILTREGEAASVADKDGDGAIGLADLAGSIKDVFGVAVSDLEETTPILARVQLCSKQRRTVERWRKYFLRKPTDSDLEGSYDDENTTILGAMEKVRDEQTSGTPPDATTVTTFDVVETQEGWAVEKLVVRTDPCIYKDEDAFNNFFDTNGDAMTG